MKTILGQVGSLEKPAVLMTVALPGSGKTTLIKRVVEELGPGALSVVCPDDIRDELAGVGKRQAAYDPALNTEVFRIANERTKAVLDMSGLAIIDATHLSRNPDSTFRAEAVQRYRELGAKTVAALVLDVPVEVAKARNEARGAEGKGHVDPGDIDKMEIYRQAHPLTPEAPGEFDVVILQPYTDESNR